MIINSLSTQLPVHIQPDAKHLRHHVVPCLLRLGTPILRLQLQASLLLKAQDPHILAIGRSSCRITVWKHNLALDQLDLEPLGVLDNLFRVLDGRIVHQEAFGHCFVQGRFTILLDENVLVNHCGLGLRHVLHSFLVLNDNVGSVDLVAA